MRTSCSPPRPQEARRRPAGGDASGEPATATEEVDQRESVPDGRARDQSWKAARLLIGSYPLGSRTWSRASSVGFRRRATHSGCVGEVFRRPAFRALFIGQAVSGLGDWMVTIALMALVLRLSGSSTAVGAVLLLRLLPAAAAAPFAARGVRGWDRRRTMQAADLVRVGIVVAIPLVGQLW